jgi:transposase InsO family protein
MHGGYIYLVAIMDWYSRYVLSWELSNSLSVSFCLAALEQAFDQSLPGIMNTDQGSQFTAHEFVNKLLNQNIRNHPAIPILKAKDKRANFAPKIGCYGRIKEVPSSRSDV